jgi:ferredoxin
MEASWDIFINQFSFKWSERMALKIVGSQCVNCSACEPECPNEAISAAGSVFVIDPAKCTECIGFHDDPQCALVCPVEETCVIDESYPRYEAA